MTYQIQPVEWESTFFGFPIGSLELPAEYSRETLLKSLREGGRRFRLICIALQNAGPDALEGLDAPCRCYDRRLTFKKQIPKSVPPLAEQIKPYTSTICSKQIEMLAIKSGAMSRFKRDPELSPQYERLFLTWINNSVSGGLADSIWTWRDNGKIVGLVTTRCARRINPESGQPEREARIGMLGVADSFQRKGIGSALLQACDFWCDSLDIPTSSLIVQQDNDAAIALCNKRGYEKTSEETVYHYWTPGWVYDTHRGWICR